MKEQEAIAAKENAARKSEMALKFLKVRLTTPHPPHVTLHHTAHHITLHNTAQEKLEQEEANTRMNMQKIDAQWRAILRKGTTITPHHTTPHYTASHRRREGGGHAGRVASAEPDV